MQVGVWPVHGLPGLFLLEDFGLVPSSLLQLSALTVSILSM